MSHPRPHLVALLVAFTLLLALAPDRALAGTARPGFTDVAVASGLSGPIAIEFLPDGTMLIAEKGGALKRGDGASGVTLTTIPVCSSGEMGLLGIAVDPGFASNGFVYLFRTRPNEPSACDGPSRLNEVVRIELAGSPAEYVDGSLTVLFSGVTTFSGHNGGVLRIGPDGKLYAATGDAAVGEKGDCPGTSTNPFAQDLGALQGKILRFDLDGTIPADNPFVGVPGAREEIFAFGFRNPFRMSFDPIGGGLWVGDVGEIAVEEIHLVTAGGNYGWPHCEAELPLGCGALGNVAPIYAYRHRGGCPRLSTLPPSLGTSVTGGAFAGALFGSRAGDYFFGDYTADAIYHGDVAASRAGIVGNPALVVSGAGGPVDFVSGPDGAMYYVAINVGQVRRLAPSGAVPANVDGYLCYKARLAPGQPRLPSGTRVDLQEPLDPSAEPFDVKREVSICTPASRDGSPLVNPDAYLEGYQIKIPPGLPRFDPSDHATVDAFDGRLLTVTAADSLLGPSSVVPGAGGAPPYAGSAVEHFQCAKAKLAKGEPKLVPPPSLVVTDAFHPSGQDLVVKKISKLCTPVAVDGSTILNAVAHLVCYQVKPPAGVRFPPTTVSTHNPGFGADVLTALTATELCLPALKE